jgi:hypothetical protein
MRCQSRLNLQEVDIPYIRPQSVGSEESLREMVSQGTDGTPNDQTNRCYAPPPQNFLDNSRHIRQQFLVFEFRKIPISNDGINFHSSLSLCFWVGEHGEEEGTQRRDCRIGPSSVHISRNRLHCLLPLFHIFTFLYVSKEYGRERCRGVAGGLSGLDVYKNDWVGGAYNDAFCFREWRLDESTGQLTPFFGGTLEARTGEPLRHVFEDRQGVLFCQDKWSISFVDLTTKNRPGTLAMARVCTAFFSQLNVGIIFGKDVDAVGNRHDDFPGHTK